MYGTAVYLLQFSGEFSRVFQNSRDRIHEDEAPSRKTFFISTFVSADLKDVPAGTDRAEPPLRA